uniref:Uncharacterized protein n=1 Tax=Arundo donax TaxID=35708 RepID=A0A0A9CC86_ARUDO
MSALCLLLSQQFWIELSP